MKILSPTLSFDHQQTLQPNGTPMFFLTKIEGRGINWHPSFAGLHLFLLNKKPRLHFQEAGSWFEIIICFQLLAFSFQLSAYSLQPSSFSLQL